MACSKIDLPELLNDIIQYFRNDFSTLHSCILVNRLWCRLTIPLLWEDPFSIPTQNYNFIEIYLRNLNDRDKKYLNRCRYGINNLFPSNTLINYPSFIKYFSTHRIVSSIEKWIAIPIERRSVYYSTSPTLIYRLLLKVFIESKADINTFEIILNRAIDFQCINESFELIVQNPNFFRNVKNLKLEKFSNLTKIYSFLKFLYSNCKSISTLYFQFQKNHHDELIEEYSSRIINSQKNLKKILFDFNEMPLYHSLLSLKNFNCSNTLKIIIFHNVNFKNINILSEVFEQLINVSVHILYCLSLNSEFSKQIIKITKPFKLKSLFLNELEIFQIEPLQLLLQKSGDYLENIGLINNEFKQQELFEVILKYCTKIKFFDLPGFNDHNIHLAFKLIENVKKDLNYLSLDIYNHSTLQELGHILPLRLEYLNLSLMTSTSNFKVFLKNSQNTFIKKLLIRNEMQLGSEDILPYIKEYIMIEKRVKYLAIRENFAEESKDLFSLKDEVNNFELYNIKVQDYYDLKIQVYNFVKEMY